MKEISTALIVALLLFPSEVYCQPPSEKSGDGGLENLAQDFWTWRAQYAPFTSDDVNRIERPGGRRLVGLRDRKTSR